MLDACLGNKLAYVQHILKNWLIHAVKMVTKRVFMKPRFSQGRETPIIILRLCAAREHSKYYCREWHLMGHSFLTLRVLNICLQQCRREEVPVPILYQSGTSLVPSAPEASWPPDLLKSYEKPYISLPFFTKINHTKKPLKKLAGSTRNCRRMATFKWMTL